MNLQNCKIWGSSLHKTTLTSDSGHKFGSPVGHPHFRSSAYKFECSPNHPQIRQLPRRLTELRKILQLQLYYSARMQIRCSQKKRCIGQILGGFKDEAFLSSEMCYPPDINVWQYACNIANPGSSPDPQWAVFIEVSLYRDGWIITSVVELSLQPCSLLEVRLIPCGLKT